MVNPYEAPAVGSVQGFQGQGSETASPGVVTALVETRPWVTFLAILGFIVCGLMVLVGLAIMVGGMPMPMGRNMGWVGSIYVVLSLLYVPPCVFLMRYRNAITQVEMGMPSLEQALIHQKSFWKYVGVFTAVLLVLYLFILGGAFLFGMSRAMG